MIYGHWHYSYVRNQGSIYTISTNAIDKGGIDHSPSAFRVVEVKENGDISTKLRYSFNAAQVNIVSPLEKQNSPVFEEGKLRESINVYNSGSELDNVLYKLIDNDKKTEIRYGKISHQLSDWNWFEKINVPSIYKGKILTIFITAIFNIGEKAISSSTFKYNHYRKTSIIEGKTWNTLLGNTEHMGNVENTFRQPFNIQWINNIGANIFMTSPIIAESKVFISSMYDIVNNKSSVSVLDLKTGKLIWRYATRNSIKNSIAYGLETILAQDTGLFICYRLSQEN